MWPERSPLSSKASGIYLVPQAEYSFPEETSEPNT